VFGRTCLIDGAGAPIVDGHHFVHYAAVNRERRAMGQAHTLDEKGRYLLELPINIAPFGDVSAIVFRRALLPLLRQGVDRVATAFHTLPEYEIYLRLLAGSTPCFVEHDTSCYSIDDENFATRHRDMDFRRRGVDVPAANMFALAALDPALRPIMRANHDRYTARLLKWQLVSARKRIANRILVREWVRGQKQRLRRTA
jgi:hypothetical protein